MRISDLQLDEYIALYESTYGIKLERTVALTQLHKLINLLLYMAFPEENILTLEDELKRVYNKGATQKV